MEQRIVETLRNGFAALYPRGDVKKLIQRGAGMFTRDVIFWRRLEVERTGTIRARVEQEGQFVKLYVAGIVRPSVLSAG